jgi:lipopolysaccharide export system permease protein
MPRLINIYIFKEMAIPFVLSMVILTITVLLGKVLKLIELFLNYDISLVFILNFIISIIPSFLIYIIPASFLVSLLIALTRMSSDSELIALKASGIGLNKIIKPVFLLAGIAFFMTLSLTLYLQPRGNHSLKESLFELARTSTAAGLEEKTFYDEFKGVILYIDKISPSSGLMKGIFISEGTTKKETRIIFAESGEFLESPDTSAVILKLNNGAIHRKKPRDSRYHIVNFSSYSLSLALKTAASGDTRMLSSKELYTKGLLERIELVRSTGRSAEYLVVDLHKRFALPAIIFAFALLGIPLGIQKVRSPKLTGFGLALGVLLSHYIILKFLEGLGDNGVINPILAAWGANIILTSIGLYVFIMAMKDKEVVSIRVIEKTTEKIGKRLIDITGFLTHGKRH